MRFLILRAAVVALAILALPGLASAQWQSSIGTVTTVGSNQTVSSNTDAEGTVYYNVYTIKSGTTLSSALSSAFGSGSVSISNSVNAPNNLPGTFNQTAYIYAYQMVNNVSGNGSYLDALSITPPASNILAGGYVGATVLNTSTSAGSLGVTTGVGGLTDYTYQGGNSTGVSWNGGDIYNTGGGQSTSLMFVISYVAPVVGGDTSFNSNVPDGFGNVPVPGPEPTTLALLALGLPVFGFGYVRRLRQKLADRSAVVA